MPQHVTATTPATRAMRASVALLVVVVLALLGIAARRLTQKAPAGPPPSVWEQAAAGFELSNMPTQLGGWAARRKRSASAKVALHGCKEEGTGQCYGEPMLDGYIQVLKNWPSSATLDDSARFLDIGSGFGRMTTFVRLHTNASAARGIEINRCRHDHALKLDAFVRARAPSLKPLDFVHGDVRNLGLGDATHVWLSAQCWPEALLHDVLRMAAASPSLRCLVLFAWKRPDNWSERLRDMLDAWGRVVHVEPVPTTWSGASAVFVVRGSCADVPRGPQRRACTTVSHAEKEMRAQADTLIAKAMDRALGGMLGGPGYPKYA